MVLWFNEYMLPIHPICMIGAPFYTLSISYYPELITDARIVVV